MDDTSFGQEIRELREQGRHGYQADFAARAGVARRTLQLVEAGKVVPTAATLEKLLMAANAPAALAQRLRRHRDIRQSARDGFSIADRDELQIPRLTSRVVAEAVRYLRRHHDVTDHEAKVLRGRVDAAIRAVLLPPVT